uniref:Uncharacterized protein n=1 Tax=Anguilla anguilla TaxID=7936 RepID=A0A0E9U225_ANGAN
MLTSDSLSVSWFLPLYILVFVKLFTKQSQKQPVNTRVQ